MIPLVAPRRVASALAAVVLGHGALCGAVPPAEVPASQRVSVVTYMNTFNHDFAYMQVSAAARGLHPKIVGYGNVAWWPDGLGDKINSLRDFVFQQVGDEELVLFVDAFDVIIFGDRAEIASRFAALETQVGKSIFFNGESHCFPEFEDICGDGYPPAPFPLWKHLNSGAIIGRGSALKRMLRDPVDSVIRGSDQAWYQRLYRTRPDLMAIDTHCKILCSTQGISGSWGIEVRNGRVANVITGTEPSVMHFVGPAHHPFWKNGTPTTHVGEVFRLLYPEASKRLLGVVDIDLRVAGSHKVKLMSLKGDGVAGYFRVMRCILCAQCRLFRSGDRECDYVPSLLSDMCSDVLILMLLVVVLCGACFAVCGRCRAALLGCCSKHGKSLKTVVAEGKDM